MLTMLDRANQLLDTASGTSAEPGTKALLVDRSGNIRLIEGETWTLPALVSAFGAREVYVIDRRATGATVEGWSMNETCQLKRAFAFAN